jgi:hypothetical protein
MKIEKTIDDFLRDEIDEFEAQHKKAYESAGFLGRLFMEKPKDGKIPGLAVVPIRMRALLRWANYLSEKYGDKKDGDGGQN